MDNWKLLPQFCNEYFNLIIEFEDDVTLSFYGDKENVQKGLREMAPFFNEE